MQPAPEFKLFDCHLHLFTDDVARFPYHGGEGDKSRIVGDPNTAEKLVALLDRNGVEAAGAVQYRKAYVTDNSYVLASAKRYPDYFCPVVILDATDVGASGQLKELAATSNVVGLRLTGAIDAAGRFPWLEGQAESTIETAARLGMFVDIMYYPTRMLPRAILNVAELADRYPRTRFLFEHFAYPNDTAEQDYGLTREVIDLARCRNVHHKLTTVNFERMWRLQQSVPDFVRRLVDIFGADRIMWGSDFGNSLQPYPDQVRFAAEACARLTPEERRLLLRETGRNFHRRTTKE